MVLIYSSPALDWRVILALTATICAGLAAYIGWRSSPIGCLAWDGQFWCWEGQGSQTGAEEQKLSVVADFQNLLLLRLENSARTHLWLWAERRAMPGRWLDLRRAVYSPRRVVRPLQHDDPQMQEPLQAPTVNSTRHQSLIDNLKMP